MDMKNSADHLRRVASRAANAATAVLFHGIAIGIVCLGLLLILAGTDHLAHLLGLLTVSQFVTTALPSLAIHIGVAAGIWGLVYGVGRQLLKRRKATRPRAVRISRGTALVETIVVLPVLLLLILGMMQLAINTTASVLTNLAGYESARAVWLWEPEIDRYPDDLDEDAVERKARLQGAAVMTPVALSYSPQGLAGADHERFEQLRGAIVGGQRGWSGSFGMSAAEDVTTQASAAYGSEMAASNLIGGLDGTDFAARSALKLNGAYAGTNVQIIRDGDERIGAHLTYFHYQNIPWVGRFFGDYEEDGKHDFSRSGAFTTYETNFTLPTQPSPHPVIPEETP